MIHQIIYVTILKKKDLHITIPHTRICSHFQQSPNLRLTSGGEDEDEEEGDLEEGMSHQQDTRQEEEHRMGNLKVVHFSLSSITQALSAHVSCSLCFKFLRDPFKSQNHAPIDYELEPSKSKNPPHARYLHRKIRNNK